MTTPELTLTVDTHEARAGMARLLAALESRADAVDAFLQDRESVPELFGVRLEHAPAGWAGHFRAVLQPTDFLRELVAAVGAGDVDLLLVEEGAHGGPHAN